MALHTVHRLACVVALLATTTTQKEQTRWSRQISSYTADISDWVPLPGPVEREPPQPKPLTPIKRQAVAEPRILTEPFPGFTRPTGFGQEFPPRNYFNTPANRQLYLQSVPSAPQNYLTEQGFGQSIRFGLSQPNFPLNQGFVAPQYTFDSVPAAPPVKPRQQLLPHVQQNPIKFDSFPKIPSNQAKPFISQALPRPKPEAPKFIDGYRVENHTNDFTFNKKKVQSLQKLKYDNFDKAPKIETIASKPKVEREEVQLLYVPLESLNRGQFNFRSPMTKSQLVNTDLYSQSLPKPNPLKQPFLNEAPNSAVKPVDTFSTSQEYYSNFDALKDDQVKYSTIASPFPTIPATTPKPKKLKPHQPPLAIFLTQDARKGNQIKVGDVLSSLKHADTIAVLDTVNPLNAPKVFIGPSSLKPPENYVRFELPYLSNIENTDKKLRQLPFFVAPLSYNTPQGFAKIPFPSPHVGSVVINSQIKDSSPPSASVIPNSYSSAPQQHVPVTQKPSFTYYSTATPNTNAPVVPANQRPHYYSFEPQSVTAISPPKEPQANAAPPKTGSYFLSNIDDRYNPQYINFPSDINEEPLREYNIGNNKRIHPETTPTTTRTTVTSTTTTKPSSTYSSQLLETHNPYSINQAFHFSTPLDYHSYYDEPYVTPGFNQGQKTSPTQATPPSSQPPKPEEVVTEKQTFYQQSSPNYVQNYSPEIHYESEVPNSRYPVYNTNVDPTKTEVSSENYQGVNQPAIEPVQPDNNLNYQVALQENIENNPPAYENLTETIINKITGPSLDAESPKQSYEQYESSHETQDQSESHQSATSSTTTTTTRRTPLRTRGRPRYTTTPRTDTTETPTRASITRRPLKERRPLPPRSRYEPNKITTEKATRKPVLDSGESTTKSGRTRTRGRVQYKHSENEDYYNKRNKGHGTKEEDLAYQRDVLHQNYPVTLMERMSTVDIEAITEPSPKLSSTKNFDSGTETYDTENAYAHEHSYIDNGSKENSSGYTGAESQTESTNNEEYIFETRSSSAPVQAISSNEDYFEKHEDKPKQTAPSQSQEIISYATESTSSTAEQSQPNYSISNEYTTKQEDPQTSEDVEITKVNSHEINLDTETEQNIVQTTPSYNRVRVRPGVIRQYHQASSTESNRNRPERRKPVQAVTYRPSFDRRRTTMRIEEIEADLKTKQVHSRPEVQDYKHPVYRPDPTTEPSVTTPISADSNTKRGHFRRRRPVYTTTSTESSSTKKTYEVKNRFRGRRPTEKPTEKPEVQTDTTTTTVRNTQYNRYSHRPRLSERFNKKTESNGDESEDQESNYSINRPKYVSPESEQWSPKISSESFKPYNPNDILEDTKIDPTEEKPIKDDSDLDIITARNDYDDILISVTPATNNRGNKKLPDIPPTLEAYVEQSKTTKSDSADSMSTFETMLEEVMKSLEEQDEDEYTSNVMKHKGGEIGEIPPERIISSGEDVTQKLKTNEPEATTAVTTEEESDYSSKDQVETKGRRRGYWKKVKVRPITESIETAESQYYANTVNRLGEAIPPSKITHDKSSKYDKPRFSVTTYKPSFQFIRDLFDSDDEISEDVLPTIDIPKIVKNTSTKTKPEEIENIEEKTEEIRTTEKPASPGDQDLGTGSPDPTIMDSMYYSTPTEPTSSERVVSLHDRADGFSLMDYFFGVTSTDNKKEVTNQTKSEVTDSTTATEVGITTEQPKSKATTTDNTYIPEEITTHTVTDDNMETVTEFIEIRKVDIEPPTETNPVVNVETSSESSFMNPANVVSTSMSTEISHETEICFRGKCIKTNKDLL